MRPIRAPASLLALALAAVPAVGQGEAAELAAMHAAPPSEWRLHIRSDTLVVDSWIRPHGPEPVAWIRARYTTARPFMGNAYDTRYTRYVGDCEQRQTRATRMIWSLGTAVSFDTAIAGAPSAAAPGTVNAAMLDRACAVGASPPAGDDPAPDVALLMVLPTARWTALGGSEGRTQYADFDGVASERGHRLLWMRVLLDEPRRVSLGTFDSMYQRWALDCAGGRVQMRRLVLAHDDRVIADSLISLDWVVPRAESALAGVLQRICAVAHGGTSPLSPRLAARRERRQRTGGGSAAAPEPVG